MTTAAMLTAAAWPLAADPEKRENVLRAVSDMAGAMIRGIDAYRHAGRSVKPPRHETVWQDGTSRLLRVNGAQEGAAPVLLVPSLINRFHILDLDARQSFVLYLRDRGYAPYILDWDMPGAAEKQFTIDDYILRRLHPAMARLNRPHVIGYCMGGTMAAGALAALADRANVRSLTALAAPWDFHAGDPFRALRMQAFSLSAQGVMAATGVLPVDWIQALFASIDPLFAFNKFRAYAEMDKDSEAARRFVTVEDWLNDGVDLAAPAARQALEEWYVENQPANGVWTIGRALADPSTIRTPALVVAAGGDRLVPQQSALALHAQIVAAEKHTPEIGHIGMMASARAPAAVWDRVVAFLAAH
ncbi:MAG: alpha/beta fold hydrolase [Rhodospirillales bacterium]|nr:alpha/beta fold hydrolase [Rhodospirillales bacterium]